jgi:release factor glutamine methyltransferase
LLNWGKAEIGTGDAEYLLGSLLGERRHELYCASGKTGTPPEAGSVPVFPLVAERFRVMTGQVRQGLPVEYVLHRAQFMGFELYVDERVLIPRSETEELVSRTLAWFHTHSNPTQGQPVFLDLGAGSGAIAIALARGVPLAKVVATDVSGAALDVAARNVQALGLTSRIELVHSDLFRFLADSGQRFDLIVTNPPYVPGSRWERLDSSVRDHEPRIALDGGGDGLRYIRPILTRGPQYLAPGGLLAMEIDPAVSRAIRQEFPEVGIEQDWQGLDRYCFHSLEFRLEPQIDTNGRNHR